MNWFKKYIIPTLAGILTVILVVMAGSLLYIAVWTETGGAIARFLGTNHTLPFKKETILFIAYGMGGVVAAIVAVAIIIRADAQARNNELIEQGHINDRFQHAAVNFRHKKRRARITSFHQFYYLAKGNNDLRERVFDILFAHLRHITSGQFYNNDTKEARLTDECQALLNVLFKSRDKSVFSGFPINLQNARLTKMDLSNMNLSNANLQEIQLKDVKLQDVHSIEKADFRGATIDDRPITKDDLPTDKGEYYADWNPPPKKEEN